MRYLVRKLGYLLIRVGEKMWSWGYAPLMGDVEVFGLPDDDEDEPVSWGRAYSDQIRKDLTQAGKPPIHVEGYYRKAE